LLTAACQYNTYQVAPGAETAPPLPRTHESEAELVRAAAKYWDVVFFQGIIDRVMKYYDLPPVARPRFEKALNGHPDYQAPRRQAIEAIAASYTMAELRTVNDFFATPTGKEIIENGGAMPRGKAAREEAVKFWASAEGSAVAKKAPDIMEKAKKPILEIAFLFDVIEKDYRAGKLR
jgi:hypothetical protein